VHEVDRALVCLAGLFNAIEPAEQLPARRVQIVVAVELMRPVCKRPPPRPLVQRLYAPVLLGGQGSGEGHALADP
jgi:hypothetical protein